MKLHILSDLHIEFGDLKIPNVDSDLTILSGDIYIGTKGLNWIKHNFKNKEVVYVLGNHEYYHCVMPEVCDILIKETKNTSIHVLENDELIIDDVVILGCTLWTNFELYGDAEVAANYAKSVMNDYNLIKCMPGYRSLDPSDTIGFYNKSFNWLSKKIKEHKDKKIIVVTHNAPSTKSCLAKYKNDLLTAAFVVDLEEFINDSNIKLWIHGHIHSVADYMIGNTRIICNSRGYCGPFDTNESEGFDSGLVIDV